MFLRCLGLALAVAIALGPSATARACDPADALLYVAAAGDGFVFVTLDRLVRVSATGEIEARRAIVDGAEVAMLGDGRTLLQLVPIAGGEECVAARYRFELVDTTRAGRPRVLGTLPAHSEATTIDSITRDASGAVTVRLKALDEDEADWAYWDVQVTPDTRRVSARAVHQEEGEHETDREAPEPRVSAPLPGPLHLAWRDVEGDRDAEPRLHVLDAAGVSRVVVAPSDSDTRAALSSDGRRLAIATYARRNEDYGTGFDGRLEILDLETGARRTVHGEGSGVASVQGTVRFACARRVRDASDLNVRAEPSPRAAVVGTLPNDTVVEVLEARGRWSRVGGAVAGWVWGDSVPEICGPAP